MYVVNNLLVKTPKAAPILVQMADHNEDGLNALARKSLPNLMNAAHQGVNQAYFDAARPTADLVMPALSERNTTRRSSSSQASSTTAR